MREARSVGAALGLVVLLSLGSPGCGSEPESDPARVRPVPELRFAGVDLVYALRRAAGEAGLPLLLDEIRPQNLVAEDLGYERVDLDLRAGPIEQVLDELREATGNSFDYRIRDGVLYVRSFAAIDQKTALDARDLGPTTLEADLKGLIHWLLAHSPLSYVQMGDRRGQPIFKKVTLDIPANSSPMDVFFLYVRNGGTGMRIRRAGFPYDEEGERVVATTIGLWEPLTEPRTLPKARSSQGAIWALASVEDRTDAVICVLDRSIMNDNRGSLNYASRLDRGRLPVEEALDAIGWVGPEAPTNYVWAQRDGVYELRSNLFQYYLTGRSLLNEKVKGGTFEGTLAELARWLNQNRLHPSDKVVMGGEIVPTAHRASIEIEEGARVEDVLFQFARAAGEGWNFVIRDSASPVEPLVGTWSGAYLSRLTDWGPRGQTPLG